MERKERKMSREDFCDRISVVVHGNLPCRIESLYQSTPVFNSDERLKRYIAKLLVLPAVLSLRVLLCIVHIRPIVLLPLVGSPISSITSIVSASRMQRVLFWKEYKGIIINTFLLWAYTWNTSKSAAPLG